MVVVVVCGSTVHWIVLPHQTRGRGSIPSWACNQPPWRSIHPREAEDRRASRTSCSQSDSTSVNFRDPSVKMQKDPRTDRSDFANWAENTEIHSTQIIASSELYLLPSCNEFWSHWKQFSWSTQLNPWPEKALIGRISSQDSLIQQLGVRRFPQTCSWNCFSKQGGKSRNPNWNLEDE